MCGSQRGLVLVPAALPAQPWCSGAQSDFSPVPLGLSGSPLALHLPTCPLQDIQVIPGTSNPRLCLISDEYSPSVAVVNCDIDDASCGQVGPHPACPGQYHTFEQETADGDFVCMLRSVRCTLVACQPPC